MAPTLPRRRFIFDVYAAIVLLVIFSELDTLPSAATPYTHTLTTPDARFDIILTLRCR